MVGEFWRRNKYIFLVIILSLALGWLSHSLYLNYIGQNVLKIPGQESVLTKVSNALTFSSAEVMSPGDHITEEQIKVYDDEIVLDIENAYWSSFTNTNSMDPTLDVTANGIEIKPQNEDEIHVGDMISYKTEKGFVIHRVIEIDADSEGIYYTVKGDNNPFADPVKVRFADVSGILVAVVY